MTDEDGHFSIPTRLLLTATQRARLLALCRQQGRDLTDVVSAIVGAYLDGRDDLVLPPETPAPALQDREALRRQVRRLRMEAQRLGAAAPAWLHAYIAELEQELRA